MRPALLSTGGRPHDALRLVGLATHPDDVLAEGVRAVAERLILERKENDEEAD